MAISLANVATSDTFQTWLNTTNFLATYLTSSIVTVNSTFSSTTGNGAIVGSLSATTLVANTDLRGGNTSVSSTLTISSNALFNGTANVSGALTTTSSLTGANVTATTNTATFGTAVYSVSNGNFGIGTSTPGYKLAVLGTSGTQQAQIGTATSYLNVTGYTSNPTYVVVGGSTSTKGIFGSETNIPVAIFTNNTEKVSVTAAGNVGISNTSPTHRLSVNGTTFLGDTTTINGNTSIAANLSVTGTITGGTLSVSNLSLTTNTLTVGTAAYFVSNGNFGIGTAGPGVKLEVNGAATIGGALTGGSLTSSANTTTIGTAMYVVSNGNIGIGNSSPGFKLDVAGTVTADYLQLDPVNTTTGEGGELLLKASNSTYSDVAIDNNVGHCRIFTLASGKYLQVVGGAGIRSDVSLGVGTDPSGTTGEIRATNNITAYYSDARLKSVKYTISNALQKVNSLSGVIYTINDTAKSFGYTDESDQVGVIAQEVEAVLPHVVKLAPFDTKFENGKEISISGENFKTVQYEKLVPLLIEAIKELCIKVEDLERRLK